jgi:hypothetical protein
MSIVTEAIGLLSEALLSSSGSIFHKCTHTEQIFLDLWRSSTLNLTSKLDDIFYLHNQLVFWANSSLFSFPRLPSAFIAFVCDDDEFRCSATQLLRHLCSGGKINSKNLSVARMLVAVAPYRANNIAAWSLDCGVSSHGFFEDCPALLREVLACVHAAASAVAALDSDSLFRRRLYGQLMSCSKDARSGISNRIRDAFATVSEKHDMGVCVRELLLSLLKSWKADINYHDPSPLTISFACILLASCQVLCESRFERQELLSSIFQGFSSADASNDQVLDSISEVVKLSRSLSESKMQCELVHESQHPFSCSTHQFDIVFPLASEISVIFDARTCADPDWDLKIIHGRHTTTCCEGDMDDAGPASGSSTRHWPGVGDTPPLTIPGTCFTVKMLESSSASWGFKFTATASYDHPLVAIQSFISASVVGYALQTVLTQQRFAFFLSHDAISLTSILRHLNFIADIASDAEHIKTLKHFCQERPAVFANIFKWVLYFSLNSTDHAATLACYERFFCFLTIAKDLIATQYSVGDIISPTSPATRSTDFTTQSCVDVFTDREFPFEMHEVDIASEAVLNLNVSSSKSKARNLLSSSARAWCSNGRVGTVRFK